MKHRSAIKLWNELAWLPGGGLDRFAIVAISHDLSFELNPIDAIDALFDDQNARILADDRSKAASFLRSWADALECKETPA